MAQYPSQYLCPSAPETAFSGASMNGLTSGSYLTSSLTIDNREVVGTSTISYDLADLEIIFASSITTGSSSTPYIEAGFVVSMDGTNYQNPPSGNAALEFVRRHRAAAEAASAETGIPANFILAQAALETGWGRKEIRPADGSNSFNLFGIKAGSNWQGATARVTTTEVIDGQPQKVKADFRAYGSYEEAFKDWARLLKDSPRYAKVVERGGDARQFAQGLQRAGYATDPAYADKLGRVINTTLRLQRMSA